MKDIKNNNQSDFKDFIKNTLIAVLFSIFIISFIGQRVIVNGESMESTLHHNQNLIMDKLTYKFSEPERFDIVVFPRTDRQLIKRIIGLPNETVKIEAGLIYINGEILEESYGNGTILDSGIASDEITLGEDEYFVLGDNRNNSIDSRFEVVGNIKKSEFLGKILFVE